MQEIFLLQALFSVAVILLEIPSGYFSDVFDRKVSIVIGGVMAFLGFGIYSQSHGFWGFLTGEVVLGIGVSFVSGADCAMLYDTMLEMDQQCQYKKIEGRNIAIGLISESAASVIGGLLALISLRLPLYCDALISLLIVPVSLTLVEPKREKIMGKKVGFKNIFSILKFALFEHKRVRWLIIYSSLVAISTLTMFWFIQPYLLETRVPLGMFGIILAVLLLFAAFFSWNAHHVELLVGKKRSLILLVLLPTLGYFMLSWVWAVWSSVFLLLFYYVRGMNNPLMLDYINGLISSDCRATILSAKNLVSRAMFSIFGPFAGWVSDAYSLRTALEISGATFFVLGMITLLFMKKHKIL